MNAGEHPQAIEEVDSEIRHLVRLVGSFAGIKTEFSCVGHKEEEQAYVTFSAQSQEDVQALLATLPQLGLRHSIMANQCRWSAAWLDATLGDDGGLRFHLRFAGSPQFMQRRLIEDFERSIKASRRT